MLQRKQGYPTALRGGTTQPYHQTELQATPKEKATALNEKGNGLNE